MDMRYESWWVPWGGARGLLQSGGDVRGLVGLAFEHGGGGHPGSVGTLGRGRTAPLSSRCPALSPPPPTPRRANRCLQAPSLPPSLPRSPPSPNTLLHQIPHPPTGNPYPPGSSSNTSQPSPAPPPPGRPPLDTLPPRRAKYHLQTLVRTMVAKDSEAFQCIFQMEDALGEGGGSFHLSVERGEWACGEEGVSVHLSDGGRPGWMGQKCFWGGGVVGRGSAGRGEW